MGVWFPVNVDDTHCGLGAALSVLAGGGSTVPAAANGGDATKPFEVGGCWCAKEANDGLPEGGSDQKLAGSGVKGVGAAALVGCDDASGVTRHGGI